MAASTKGKSKGTKRSPSRETKATTLARKQMWAVVLFALGILLGALTFVEGDKLWKILHQFLFNVGAERLFSAPLLIYTPWWPLWTSLCPPFRPSSGRITLIVILSGPFRFLARASLSGKFCREYHFPVSAGSHTQGRPDGRSHCLAAIGPV